MNRRKPTYFRNSLDLRDRVQVKIIRKRLKLTGDELSTIVRKVGTSINAISKEAGISPPAD
jgi:Protein of unknown function (DUF3606)